MDDKQKNTSKKRVSRFSTIFSRYVGMICIFIALSVIATSFFTVIGNLLSFIFSLF